MASSSVIIKKGVTPSFLARILNTELASEAEITELNDLLSLTTTLTQAQAVRKAELLIIINNALLKQSDVSSIYYNIERAFVIDIDDDEPYTVTGHTNVQITNVNTVIQEQLITNDALWTTDKIGYNFKWSPSIVTNEAFPTTDTYEVSFTINLTNGRNPIRWTRSLTIT